MVRLVVRVARLLALLKAEQLGLFGRPALEQPEGSGPTLAPRPAGPSQQSLFGVQRVVRGHVRQTDHGIVAVAPHVRTVHVAHHEPPPEHPAPTPEPVPSPALTAAPAVEPTPTPTVAPEPTPKPKRKRAAKPTPAPAPTPTAEPDPEPNPDVWVTAPEPEPEPAAAPVPIAQPVLEPEPKLPDDQPAKLGRYLYVTQEGEGPPPWLPTGARTHPNGMIELPEPLFFGDIKSLGLRPVDEAGEPRHFDAYENGVFSRKYVDKRGSIWDEQVLTSGAPPRTLFKVLSARLDDFQTKFDGIVKKANKLGLEPPQLEKIQETTSRVPVGVDGWGDQAATHYADLPAVLLRVTGPELKVKGWTIEAVIKPLPGTERTMVTKVGRLPDLPLHLRHTGMHCDQCGADRDRSFVVALHNTTSGHWKQVGGSCLADFTGRSAGNLASTAEYLANWWKSDDDGGWDTFGAVGSGTRYNRLDDVLAAALHVVDDQAGFVSRRQAEEQGIKPTADIVRTLLASPLKAAAVKSSAGLAERVGAVKQWMHGLDPDSPEEYTANLYAIGQSGLVPHNAIGLAVSAVAAHARAQDEARAKRERATAKHFGKPGDKIGRKLSAKDKKEGAEAHPARRVKVTHLHSYNTEYGPSTIVTMKDDEGHTFKWKASGGFPDHANPIPGVRGQDVRKGETFDLIGTIKGHSEWKGHPQTDVTRAELHRVYTPSERAELDRHSAHYEHKERDRAAAIRELHEEFAPHEAEWDARARESTDPTIQKNRIDGGWKLYTQQKLQQDPHIFLRADWDRNYAPTAHDVSYAARKVADADALKVAALEHAHEMVRQRAAATVFHPLEKATQVRLVVRSRTAPAAGA